MSKLSMQIQLKQPDKKICRDLRNQGSTKKQKTINPAPQKKNPSSVFHVSNKQLKEIFNLKINLHNTDCIKAMAVPDKSFSRPLEHSSQTIYPSSSVVVQSLSVCLTHTHPCHGIFHWIHLGLNQGPFPIFYWIQFCILQSCILLFCCQFLIKLGLTASTVPKFTQNLVTLEAVQNCCLDLATDIGWLNNCIQSAINCLEICTGKVKVLTPASKQCSICPQLSVLPNYLSYLKLPNYLSYLKYSYLLHSM